MPSSETIELRKVKSVVGSKGDLPKVNPRSSIISRLSAVLLRVAGVPQLIHLYGALEPNKTLTLVNAAEEFSRGIASDGINLYVALSTDPGIIVKIDLSTFTQVASLTLDVADPWPFPMVSDGTYLYVGLETDPGGIVRIDIESFTKVDKIDFAVGETQVQALFSDGTNLYAGTLSSPSKIIKIDLNTFTYVSTLDLPAGENICKALYGTGGFLYAGLATNPGKIVKINLNTFTAESTLTFDVGDIAVYALSTDGTHLYAGLYTDPAIVVKVDISSFSIISKVEFGVGERNVTSQFIDGTFLYLGLSTNPGMIVRVDLAMFEQESTITLPAGNSFLRALFSDGTYIYTGATTSPANITRRYTIPTSNLFEREIDLVHEQVHSGNHLVYPTLAAAIVATSSAVAWTMGNYIEIIPVNSVKNMYYITGIVVNNMVIDSEYEINIATGLGAAEVIIGTFTHETHDTNLSCIIPLSQPLKVSSNTRISARCASENAAPDTCTIKLMYKL